MNLSGSRILLTGASGGIGRCLALELAARGADLALLARDGGALAATEQQVRARGVRGLALAFDLGRRDCCAQAVDAAIAGLGGLDGLVNNAGISSFCRYATEDPCAIAHLLEVNVHAPLLLTRAALPHFLRQNAGHIVNIGSILGSIALPHFAAYSAAKFAVRGFSEALRRELHGTGVRVTYVAPRTTATGLNSAAARDFMSETGAAVDPPETVARLIADAMEADCAERYVGATENMFVRVNALAPRIVDRAIARHRRIAQRLLPDPGP